MFLSFVVGLSAQAAPVPDNSLLNHPERDWALQPHAEIGTLAPLSHTIQFGEAGTDFNYIQDGGQDNLFLFTRWWMDLSFGRGTTVTFLYQPLNLVTQREADQELVFNNTVFPKGSAMEYRYGFDFYRTSITWDLLAKDPNNEWSLGASLQIRNATINIGTVGGGQLTTNRDIGPVPIIKTRGRFEGDNRWWGFEADGFYAPIKYINGAESDVVGAILDSSLRVGLKANHGIDPFLNLRYLGGGAVGTENDPDPGKDGYVRNWIHLASLSLGFAVR